MWKCLKKSHEPILALAAISSLFFMAWQIQVQSNATDLDTRPYVSVDIASPQYIQNEKDPSDTYYGNDILLTNRGKTPASRVQTAYYITTDKDRNNMHSPEWFRKHLGGFGSVSFITPGEIRRERGKRSLSPTAIFYYFEAMSSYQGLDDDRTYWTHIRKVFSIDQGRRQLYLVCTYGEWDRNKNFSPPSISKTSTVIAIFERLKKSQDCS